MERLETRVCGFTIRTFCKCKKCGVIVLPDGMPAVRRRHVRENHPNEEINGVKGADMTFEHLKDWFERPTKKEWKELLEKKICKKLQQIKSDLAVIREKLQEVNIEIDELPKKIVNELFAERKD